MKKNHVIILASGNGERLGSHIPKQFIKIAGKTIIEHTLDLFEKNERIDDILIVINSQYRLVLEEILLKNDYKKIVKILNGGKTRKESSYIGLQAIDNETDKVLIHDAVRPFLDDSIINSCLNALDEYNAIDVAIDSADTIIKVNEDNFIEEIPNRTFLKRGQTPQAFRVGIIKKAHALSKLDGYEEVTDDCGLVLKYGLSDVFVVHGAEKNIKITHKEDLYMADRLFQLQSYKSQDYMDFSNLKDKVIVIFGGSKGIGKSIKEISLEYGAKVYSFSRENGVNVKDYESVRQCIKSVHSKEKQINYVINTAGVLSMGKINNKNIKDIEEEIQINYLGSVNVVKASIDYIPNGSILLYTSSSYTRGRSLYSIYSSTKAAIVNLVQALADELSDKHIKINAINPERTNTPMRRENFGIEPEGTLLDPNKVAEASLQTLLSDLSGQVIDVRK